MINVSTAKENWKAQIPNFLPICNSSTEGHCPTLCGSLLASICINLEFVCNCKNTVAHT